MHLLNAQAVSNDDDGEGVDLAQTPGEIVVLSAADTELSGLAAAQARRAPDAPTLRLANLLKLRHPLSVDLYVERIVARARLVLVRLLGGRSYWPYGLEQVAATCRARGIPLAALPGDDQPDPELDDWSTLDAAARHRLWQYLVHGGPSNLTALLAFAGALIGKDETWREPAPLLKAGLYWPGVAAADLDAVRFAWVEGRPVAGLVFYRALVQAADLRAVDALIQALSAAGLNPLPLYVTSLKDPLAAALVDQLFAAMRPEVVLNATGFAVGDEAGTPLDRPGRPVLQVVFASGDEAGWRAGTRGLSPRDLGMHVALPEVDGRVLTRAVAFKSARLFDARTETPLVSYEPVADRVRFTAELAAAWTRLARTPVSERRVAVVLANYPNRDGRIANGVGLDVPASAVVLLDALKDAGYGVDELPVDGAGLIARLLEGPTNLLEGRAGRRIEVTLGLDVYRDFFKTLPDDVRAAVEARWGAPEDDPHVTAGAFALALIRLGNIALGIQPARGYGIDPEATYHSPDLVPPHGYFAFYAWLRRVFGVHAIVHLGKHGNLEWLPGKALALSNGCLPEAVLGPLPHLYPFIVNDPGEGSQAKRRTAAVIVDHLTPPMTRAEIYGPLAELERLVDEFYEASALDARRAKLLKGEILDAAARLGLDKDLGLEREDEATALSTLDNHLCEIKELQIRDGLHVLGVAPAGEPLVDLAMALARVPRGAGEGADASLQRAIAHDLDLDFDPLTVDYAPPWTGLRPDALARSSDAPWRTAGDTVERIELLARTLVAQALRSGTASIPSLLPRAGGAGVQADPAWHRAGPVLNEVRDRILPAVRASGPAEIQAILAGLEGRFVVPGPAGAPTRGRLDVLPTGRNFYSVDTRAVPTPAAWQLGWRSAEMVVERHLQEHGDWPKAVALSAWGTANMRTGGDDVAQALALMGVRPVWDGASHRVTGLEVMPPGLLDRPRVDVTFRVSGFFRDAFPAQIELIDRAVRAVADQDEPDDVNPIRARVRAETDELMGHGIEFALARRRASFRVFGSKPGAYGAGLQALIDERGWTDAADLARAYVAWGGYAYGAGAEGRAEHRLFERRLGSVEAVLHNQDNREHDILDSDDYYQFEGGLMAAVREHAGQRPAIYHNDHSRPERPVVRPLKEEIARIVRGRAANPKWLKGIMRHGYKGAFEIAATVDYLFAFAATTGVVEDHHFDALYDAYLGDEDVRSFMVEVNPAALVETAERFREALQRGLWRPRSNRAPALLDELIGR